MPSKAIETLCLSRLILLVSCFTSVWRLKGCFWLILAVYHASLALRLQHSSSANSPFYGLLVREPDHVKFNMTTVLAQLVCSLYEDTSQI